jgi:hypothetical protein
VLGFCTTGLLPTYHRADTGKSLHCASIQRNRPHVSGNLSRGSGVISSIEESYFAVLLKEGMLCEQENKVCA